MCFEVKNELSTVAAMTHRCTPEAVEPHMGLGSRKIDDDYKSINA